MVASMLVFDPVVPRRNESKHLRHTLNALTGKVVGFVDNGKPNFNYLVDDLSELLVNKYGVASVIKYQKRGNVPVLEPVMKELTDKCDAVITGSGD